LLAGAGIAIQVTVLYVAISARVNTAVPAAFYPITYPSFDGVPVSRLDDGKHIIQVFCQISIILRDRGTPRTLSFWMRLAFFGLMVVRGFCTTELT